ncbi:MAG: T9SS type A sorting domain-containing protein, partial [Candidatus Cloacimonetes bacterium]|nr:T9SS type A sorting domain-containing protein [Candidatus Cloacimonadota bacterium]
AIKSFIQSEYDADNGLTFVQLVGDNAQVATFSSGGGGSDPSYSLLEGTDSYPEIFVGRFSAENVSQVETQVERTVHYERDLVEGDWLHKGMGVGSSEGAGQGDDGEADWVHLDNIRIDLMDFTYTEVDQIYDTNGGNSTQVTNALNEGRSIINYTGHGSNTSWSSTGFSNDHVNSLTNDYRLPFINSVACVNGNFTSTTCFGEAWLRATNNSTGAPTGAVAVYMSSINQSWAPPMRCQDEYVDLLCGAGDYEGFGTQKSSIGGLWYNGSCDMLDVYGSQGDDMFETWIIFGDASLQVRTDTPEMMTINHLPTIFIGFATFDVSTGVENALVSLTSEDGPIASGYTNASGNVTLDLTDLPDSPMDLTLTTTAFNKVTEIETIELIPPGGAYLVISEISVDAGGDDEIEFGESVNLSVTIENVGTEQANAVDMVLSIDDEYITLTDAAETIGDLPAGNSIELIDAFSFDVSNFIPDMYDFQFYAEMTERNSWEGYIDLTAFAPVIVCADVMVDDGENGTLDPGETTDIIVNLENTGGARATSVSAVLSTFGDLITINSDYDEVSFINAYSSGNLTFNITVSEDAPSGVHADFDLNISADNEYDMEDDFSLTIGISMEDFETGDFSNYNWEFGGSADWTISTQAYEGNYSALSGTIGNSDYSSLILEAYVLNDDEISFMRKVSSEDTYDFLRFYIDEELQGEWSGDMDWNEVSYPVTFGDHTFTWIYSKDGSVSHGSDCGWIDNIIFPPIGVPVPPELDLNITEIDMEIDINTTETEILELTNSGGGTLNYTISLLERDLTGSYLECSATEFTPGETVFWTFTVYNNSGDNEWISSVIVDFPAGVTVNSSTDMTGGSGDLVSDGTTGDGIQLSWIDPDEGWGEIYPNESGSAVVGVTISSGFVGDINLSYQIIGDQYGGEPHTINGEIMITSMGQPIPWISLDSSSGSLNPGDTDEITVTFDATEIEPGTYNCEIIINDNTRDQTIIPVTLLVSATGPIDDPIPAFTQLVGNYPNPFNPVTTISYSLNKKSPVSLMIYNSRGQKVRTLVASSEEEVGNHSITWNGQNDQQQGVSSGVYFYKLKAGRYTSTKKMILMK